MFFNQIHLDFIIGIVIPQRILACHIVSGSLTNLQGYEKEVEVHLNTNQLLQISQQKSVK